MKRLLRMIRKFILILLILLLPVQGFCTIDITDLGGNQRKIIASGMVDNYIKRIETELILNGNIITVTSWVEN